MPDVSFSSPTYPFRRVIAANTFRGAELIPYKIIRYLMDLPDAYGYAPPDDNDYPRCRLKKILWYDSENPLDNPMPTAAQIRSLLFDPENPDINTDEDKEKHPKGYRLFAQRNIGQSGIEAKTLLKVYPGRILDDTDFRAVIGMQMEIWTNVNLVTNTRTTAYDRTFDIEQCVREAMAGVDIGGVGTIKFSRQASSYNGSEILYTDDSAVGRMLYFSVSWAEGGGGTIKTY